MIALTSGGQSLGQKVPKVRPGNSAYVCSEMHFPAFTSSPTWRRWYSYGSRGDPLAFHQSCAKTF